MPKARCPHCGAEFTPDACRTRYCDGECYRADQRAQADATLVARFWAKVDRRGACWLWTGSRVKGYGQVHLRRDPDGRQHTVYAHRLAWTITNGPIHDHLQVCHHCDTPLCCNPNHLFLGTQQDNLTDARQKGRLVDGRHLIKVDDAGVRDICRTYRPRHNGKQLAAKYGISLVSLLRIVNGTQRVSQRQAAGKIHRSTPVPALPSMEKAEVA